MAVTGYGEPHHNKTNRAAAAQVWYARQQEQRTGIVMAPPFHSRWRRLRSGAAAGLCGQSGSGLNGWWTYAVCCAVLGS